MIIITRVRDKRQITEALRGAKSCFIHEDEWQNWELSDDLTCVVHNNNEPIALFTLDTRIGYLQLLDVVEDYQSKLIGKALLFCIFNKFNNIQRITGVSSPEALLFWVRVGAYFERPLNETWQTLVDVYETSGEFPFINFELDKIRYKHHLVETSFFDRWLKCYGFRVEDIQWRG